MQSVLPIRPIDNTEEPLIPVCHFMKPPCNSPPPSSNDVIEYPNGVYGSMISYRISYKIFLKSRIFPVNSKGIFHKNQGGLITRGLLKMLHWDFFQQKNAKITISAAFMSYILIIPK